jgi:hypothetical protein
MANGTRMTTPDPEASPPRGAVEETDPVEWTHDHCELCWATLTFPAKVELSEAASYAEGFTPADSQPGAGRVWVCPTCFTDFQERFGWKLV